MRAQLFGVLGDPVDHSLSPTMHNAAFEALRLPHLYLRWRVAPAELPEALAEARRLRVAGLNLTVPLKEAALPLLDGLTAEARRMGAVNTLTLRGNRLVGDNTDGRGFLRALRGQVRLRGARVVVIGAGGSARAVGTALLGAGIARLEIVNRTPARAAALAERLRTLGGCPVGTHTLRALLTGEVLGDADLVVNTTSLGLKGAGPLTRWTAAPRACVAVDLVYGRKPSPWLAVAARSGHPTSDGAGMLLHQGALAFETWTGRRAPLAAMTRALRSAGLALTGPRPHRSIGVRAR